MNTSALTLPLRVIAFALWFAKEIVVSSLSVVRDALTPGRAATPRVVRMELGEVGDVHVTMISILITLTPGTLTLGTRRAGARGEEPGDPGATRLLYVHGLYADDADALRGEIHDMERRLLHAMRKQGVA